MYTSLRERSVCALVCSAPNIRASSYRLSARYRGPLHAFSCRPRPALATSTRRSLTTRARRRRQRRLAQPLAPLPRHPHLHPWTRMPLVGTTPRVMRTWMRRCWRRWGRRSPCPRASCRRRTWIAWCVGTMQSPAARRARLRCHPPSQHTQMPAHTQRRHTPPLSASHLKNTDTLWVFISTLPQLPSSLYPLHHPSPSSLLHVQVDVIYVFAFVWSFGCNLDDGSRAKFNDFVSALLSPLIPDEVRGHDLFGFYVDPHSLALVPWAKQMNKFQYDPKVCMCGGGGAGQWACVCVWVLMG
jgi:hypothetical protein